jgi:polyphosphate kinase
MIKYAQGYCNDQAGKGHSMTQEFTQEHIQPPNELERPELYLNRELSLIEFNRRVFEEAKDPRHPLLERVKFISIFETNTDEFYMIRLAGLRDQVASRAALRSPDGLTAQQQLKAVRRTMRSLQQEVRTYWREIILPLLIQEHIFILDYEQLNDDQRAAMREYFEQEIFPVLTPLAVDTGHPFPHISNRSLNLAVVLADPAQDELFARLKVPLPPTLPRFIQVPTSHICDGMQPLIFVWLEQVIAANLQWLFPGFDIWESYAFRVIRDADIELQEDEADDLLEYIEQEVRERRFGTVVNLEVNPTMPKRIRDLLIKNLELGNDDLTVLDGPLGMGDVMELLDLDRPELKDEPFLPRTPQILKEVDNIFSAIQEHDILLHHPYDSFSSVIDFIRQAAEDPQVLAIKQTLYRVGTNAPIVNALLQAVENGKQVAVLVELKARFDEANNIVWARELEKAGVHVVYGLVGIKTHAKIAMVIRKESQGLKRYLHIGTGNYNAQTAKVYEDLGLLTCQPDLGIDATALFNALTGYSRQSNYCKLLVAPKRLRRGIIERIEREIQFYKKSGHGRLIFKMNALADPDIIRHLYRASQAGISIDLIIRGVCALCPGIFGISDNIRVRSLVGRFLEHSRIYYFGNNGEAEIYIGSADMMQRNLNTRVELLCPIISQTLRTWIIEQVLRPILKDTANAHELQPDGSYKRIEPTTKEQEFDCQDWFLTQSPFDVSESGDISNGTSTTISAIPSSS